MITLVHGTFAKNSNWTKDHKESLLINNLKEILGNNYSFQRHEWSGKNNIEDRKNGGDELAKKIVKQSGYKHIIISHSHGGNVALYSTKFRKVEELLDGIICLNTPNLFAMKRNFKPLFTLFRFALYGVFYVTFFYAFFGLLFNNEGNWYSNILYVLLFSPLFVLFASTFKTHHNNPSKYIERIEIDRDKTIEYINPFPTKSPVLSIWTGGDEISFGFDLVSGISNIPFLFLYMPVVLTSMLSIMVGLFINLDLAVGPNILNLSENLFWLSSTIDFILYMINLFLMTCIFFILMLVCIMVIILSLNSFFYSYIFGLKFNYKGTILATKLITTPIPVQAKNTEFKSIDLGAIGISHSLVYSNDLVIKEISDWINELQK